MSQASSPNWTEHPLEAGDCIHPLSFNLRPPFRQTVDMSFRAQIIPLDALPAWRKQFRDSGRTLVVTNGCFDLLHLGHVTYLEVARQRGDALLVGVNGDQSVRGLKGPSRPVNSEADRAGVLAGLRTVEAVSIFPEKRAVRFLELAQPDIYVKGGDYTLETIDPEERRTLEDAGARIVFLPFLTGKSTSALLKQIN
jgi:D-glycero-beta-D-manno-heptose 1-phosphate adenylyltransferase